MSEAITVAFGEQEREWHEDEIQELADMFAMPGWAMFQEILEDHKDVCSEILDRPDLGPEHIPNVYKASGQRAFITEQLAWPDQISEAIKLIRNRESS